MKQITRKSVLAKSLVIQSNTLSIWQAAKSIKPFGQEIFLLKIFVTGTYFTEAENIVGEKTVLPLQVKLQREPSNIYDEPAILVLTESGEKLGYIPRKKNEVIARLMDASKRFSAKIVSRNMERDWLKVDLRQAFRFPALAG